MLYYRIFTLAGRGNPSNPAIVSPITHQRVSLPTYDSEELLHCNYASVSCLRSLPVHGQRASMVGAVSITRLWFKRPLHSCYTRMSTLGITRCRPCVSLSKELSSLTISVHQATRLAFFFRANQRTSCG